MYRPDLRPILVGLLCIGHAAPQTTAPNTPPEEVTVLRIGWLGSTAAEFEMFGAEDMAGFLVAVQLINSNPQLYLGNGSMRVEPYVFPSVKNLVPTGDVQMDAQRDMATLTASSACDVGSDRASALDVHAVVVGGGTSAVVHLASQYISNNKPIIGYSADGDLLSDKKTWPTFSRVISSERYEMMALARLIYDLGWTRVGVITSTTHIDKVAEFSEACAALGAQVVATVTVPQNLNSSRPNDQRTIQETAAVLQRRFLAANVRVYLVASFAVDTVSIGRTILASGMYGPQYTIITTATTTAPISGLSLSLDAQMNSWAALLGDSWQDELEAVQPLLQGSLGVTLAFDPSAEAMLHFLRLWPQSQQTWDALLSQSPQRPAVSADLPPSSVQSVNGMYAFDATLLMCQSIAQSVKLCANGNSVMNTTCVMQVVRQNTLSGSTGQIRLDDQGDRMGSFIVTNIGNGVQRSVGTVQFTGPDASDAQTAVNIRSIVWSDDQSNRISAPQWGQDTHAPTMAPTSTPTPPLQEPRIIHEQHSRNEDAVLSVGLALAGLGCVVFVYIAWRRYDAKRKENMPADFQRVLERLSNYGKLGGGGVFATADEADELQEQPLSHEHAPLCDFGELLIPQELKRKDVILQDVIGQGQFGNVTKGVWTTFVGRSRVSVPVAVKALQHDGALEQLRFLEEAALAWQFDHPNVVKMYGVVSSGFPYLLVLELCEQGSLLGYVQGETHSSGHLLKILYGVVSGMAFLASRRFVHRDLAARNVVLNAQIKPKISDFGLGRSLEGGEYYRMSSETPLPLRWTEPAAVISQVFTEATDVWAFGVTAIETFTRGERPYSDWPNTVVLERVHEGYRLPRPSAMPVEVYDTIVSPCWWPSCQEQMSSETFGSSNVRPKFQELKLKFEESMSMGTDGSGAVDTSGAIPHDIEESTVSMDTPVSVNLPHVKESVMPSLYVYPEAGAGASTEHATSSDGTVRSQKRPQSIVLESRTSNQLDTKESCDLDPYHVSQCVVPHREVSKSFPYAICDVDEDSQKVAPDLTSPVLVESSNYSTVVTPEHSKSTARPYETAYVREARENEETEARLQPYLVVDVGRPHTPTKLPTLPSRYVCVQTNPTPRKLQFDVTSDVNKGQLTFQVNSSTRSTRCILEGSGHSQV